MLPNLSELRCGCASVDARFDRLRDALDDLSIDPRRKRNANWVEDGVCVICLGLLTDDEEFYNTGTRDVEAIVEHPDDPQTGAPRCNHIFHIACLRRHVEKAVESNAVPRCPSCRIAIPGDTVFRLTGQEATLSGDGNGNDILDITSTDDEDDDDDEEPEVFSRVEADEDELETTLLQDIDNYIDRRRNDFRGYTEDLRDEFETFAALNAPRTLLPRELVRWRRAAIYKFVTEQRRQYAEFQEYLELDAGNTLSTTMEEARAATRRVQRIVFELMDKAFHEATEDLPYLTDTGHVRLSFP